MIKGAEALNFSNNDVALRGLSYYEMRGVKSAVGNSKAEDLNLAADTIFNLVMKFPVFMETKHALRYSNRPTNAF